MEEFCSFFYLHQTSIKQDRKVVSYKVKKSPFLRDSLIQIQVELQEAWSQAPWNQAAFTVLLTRCSAPRAATVHSTNSVYLQHQS